MRIPLPLTRRPLPPPPLPVFQGERFDLPQLRGVFGRKGVTQGPSPSGRLHPGSEAQPGDSLIEFQFRSQTNNRRKQYLFSQLDGQLHQRSLHTSYFFVTHRLEGFAPGATRASVTLVNFARKSSDGRSRSIVAWRSQEAPSLGHHSLWLKSAACVVVGMISV